MRRLPQQQRGLERVERILQAAAEIFGESGFEGATTNLIAERAKTSIGSLYQFFPNKQSIVDALAQRYAKTLSTTLMMQATNEGQCDERLAMMIDVLFDFYLAHPGFRSLFFGCYEATQAQALEQKLHQPIAHPFALIIREVQPQLSDADVQRDAELAVQHLVRLLHYCASQDSSQHEIVLDKIKWLITFQICPELNKTGD
ncbi:MAG: TetR/AcrR family transcriptional regulator [Chloroflexota bacterium]|nr:TetR/AcrR family transcriptional regulator [Chloroflexota bacterium]